MPSIFVELHDGRPGPVELQIPPEKTAAKVLDACCRKLNLGVGRLSPKGKPNLFLQDDDMVADGVTCVFTPPAGPHGMHRHVHVISQADSQDIMQILCALLTTCNNCCTIELCRHACNTCIAIQSNTIAACQQPCSGDI